MRRRKKMREITAVDMSYTKDRARKYMSGGYYDDQVVSAAYEGLGDAAGSFDEDMGVSFKYWAGLKIRGSIYGHLRNWLGRNGQKNPPVISMTDVERSVIDEGDGRSMEYELGVFTDSAEDIVIAKDYYEKFMSTLKPHEKRRYTMYRLGGLTMREIGEKESVGEAAVSQTIKNVSKAWEGFDG